tara:strand:+ start:1807 stop:2025 length:219 start_codon:yes stop_codon:yes gene_type:complete
MNKPKTNEEALEMMGNVLDYYAKEERATMGWYHISLWFNRDVEGLTTVHPIMEVNEKDQPVQEKGISLARDD